MLYPAVSAAAGLQQRTRFRETTNGGVCFQHSLYVQVRIQATTLQRQQRTAARFCSTSRPYHAGQRSTAV